MVSTPIASAENELRQNGLPFSALSFDRASFVAAFGIAAALATGADELDLGFRFFNVDSTQRS